MSYITAPRATGIGLLDTVVATLGYRVQMQFSVLVFVTSVAMMLTGLAGMVLLSRRMSSRIDQFRTRGDRAGAVVGDAMALPRERGSQGAEPK